MRRWIRILAGLVLVALLVGLTGLMVVARRQARELVTNPAGARTMPGSTPARYGLPFERVTVATGDGLTLAGWFVPSAGGAVIIAQHGYKAHRGEMLNEAAMLYANGYGVLMPAMRAHDQSEGELITFGAREMDDYDAWFGYLAGRGDVDAARIAMLGNSMGGTLAIQYASINPAIRAVIANSAFSSLDDTVDASLRFFTGLPSFPFGPMIVFWAEHEAGVRAGDVDAKRWIGQLSPRPVLLMQGGKDSVISRDSGRRLFEAAGEPKELWFDPELRHTAFDTVHPDEYERRVVAFLRRYLR